MPDYEQSDYIEQHREDAERAGLEWFWPPDDDESSAYSKMIAKFDKAYAGKPMPKLPEPPKD